MLGLYSGLRVRVLYQGYIGVLLGQYCVYIVRLRVEGSTAFARSGGVVLRQLASLQQTWLSFEQGPLSSPGTMESLYWF